MRVVEDPPAELLEGVDGPRGRLGLVRGAGQPQGELVAEAAGRRSTLARRVRRGVDLFRVREAAGDVVPVRRLVITRVRAHLLQGILATLGPCLPHAPAEQLGGAGPCGERRRDGRRRVLRRRGRRARNVPLGRCLRLRRRGRLGLRGHFRLGGRLGLGGRLALAVDFRLGGRLRLGLGGHLRLGGRLRLGGDLGFGDHLGLRPCLRLGLFLFRRRSLCPEVRPLLRARPSARLHAGSLDLTRKERPGGRGIPRGVP